MKMIIIIMTALLVQASAAGLAQNVTYVQKNASLEQIFTQIRKQTGYDVLVPAGKLNINKKIDADFKQASLENVMAKALENLGMTYGIDEKTIVIKPKEPSLLDKLASVIQSVTKDLTVRGVVKDQDGKPLPNASIRVKGKSAVTNTNAEGEFEIKGVADDAVLLVSYVGFRTLELPLKDAVMPLEIKLNVATGELEEVKVVYNTGYQELNKERSTGSFIQIDNELLNRTPTANILDRLASVTSGLIYDRKLERTGKSPYQIRGLGTINASDKPLIVIDGFPYDEPLSTTGNAFPLVLKDLNPNDVENITILRDAAAASIWGARASNGVIVITTKKGKFNQKTNIAFMANTTIQDKPNLNYLQRMSAGDAVEAQTDLFSRGVYNVYDDTFPISKNFPALPEAVEILLAARKKNSGIVGYNAINDPSVKQQLEQLVSRDLRNDVNKYFLQTGFNQQYSMNISGGSDLYNFYASAGYDKRQGTSVRDDDNRLTLKIDNNWKPLKNLSINGYINYAQSTASPNSFGYTDLLNSASLYSRLADEDGNALALPYQYRKAYVDTASFPALMDWHYHPLKELDYNNKTNKTSDIRLGGGLRYSILNGLSMELKYQYQKLINNNRNANNENSFFSSNEVNRFMYKNGNTAAYPVQKGAIVDVNSNNQNYWNARGQINYNKKINLHEIAAIAGIDISERSIDLQNSRMYGFNEQTGTFQTLINYETLYAAKPQGFNARIAANTSYFSQLTRLRSYYANASYTYDGRFIFSLSGRQDGANLFGLKTNQKVNPLWSTGVMWNLSNEKFYSFPLIPVLRLRSTYGYNGNMSPNATTYPVISFLNDPTTGELSAFLSSPPNPYLSWERTKVINFGLDFESKSNRLSGNLEYYFKNGIDLIGPITNDPTTGVASYTGNRSSIKGQGIDLTLNSRNVQGLFQWNTMFNFSYNTHKVTKYSRLQATNLLVSGGGAYLGRPYDGIYSYKWAGLDPENGDPRGYLNGDIATYTQVTGLTGSIANTKPEDLIYHGRSTPQISGNILNTVIYQGFSLSFNIGYKFKYFFRRNSISYSQLFPSGTFGGGTSHKDYALRWIKKGDEAFTNVPSFPASNIGARESFYAGSEILVEKGDHIRLQDINLSYDLTKILCKTPLRRAQFYFNITNIGILWRANNQNLDPDYYTSEIPAAKSYVMGINLNF